MILKNHSISGVRLFGVVRQFSLPFVVYQYYSSAWGISDHWSEMWNSGCVNSRLGVRWIVMSGSWSKNI